MCVCVCVCGFMCVCEWVGGSGVDGWVGGWVGGCVRLLNSTESLHSYFRMKQRTFLTGHFINSQTRGGQRHDLTSVRLALKT